MAYNTTYGLTRQSNALGFYLDAGQTSPSQVSRWGYASADAAATVETAGYFNAASSTLGKGDIIEAVLAISATPVNKTYIVTSASGATPVTVGLQTTTAG